MTPTPPKLFISYSWSSQEHEDWVLSLAIELRESGVDVVLDKWELREGNDAHKFMEKMVNDPDVKKVVLVCDQQYAEKANDRSGGVGTETRIISPKLYSQQEQTKFVAVLPERDSEGDPYLPTYYESRIYIDLSDSDSYGKNFDQLLRWAFDKPLHSKPDLGSPPAFLDNKDAPTLQTSARFRRAMDGVREGRSNWLGSTIEYFETFASNLENFRIDSYEGEFDDAVVARIDEFTPFREEFVEFISALARYKAESASWEALHKFFEALIPYLEGEGHGQDWANDNLRFVIHELFLSVVGTLLQSECFSGLEFLLQQRFYLAENQRQGKDPMVSFATICKPVMSLFHRNKRLSLNRVSVQADLLKERAEKVSRRFPAVMQADFVLFLRDGQDCLDGPSYQTWHPISLIFSGRQHGAMEVFARCQSRRFFDRFIRVLGVSDIDEFFALLDALKDGPLEVPHWNFHRVNPGNLVGRSKICSLP